MFDDIRHKNIKLLVLAGACFLLLSSLGSSLNVQAQVPGAANRPNRNTVLQRQPVNRPTPKPQPTRSPNGNPAQGPSTTVPGSTIPTPERPREVNRPESNKPVNRAPDANKAANKATPTPTAQKTPANNNTAAETSPTVNSTTPSQSPAVNTSSTRPAASPSGSMSTGFIVTIAVVLLLIGILVFVGIRFGATAGGAPAPQIDVKLLSDADPKIEVAGNNLPSLDFHIDLKFKSDPGRQSLSKPVKDPL